MFCNQCEQTSKGIACTTIGICGKKPEIAALQDALLYALQGLAIYAHEAGKRGIVNSELNNFNSEAIFATLTNVNFDRDRLGELIRKAVDWRKMIEAQLLSQGDVIKSSHPTTRFEPAMDTFELIKQGEEFGLIINQEADEDIKSLQELLLYGIKGVAAYAHHAAILGQEDERVYAFLYQSLAEMGNRSLTLNEWLERVMKCGEINLLAMQLLDTGNTSRFGHPVPTEVPLGHKAGQCILVSGHDLKDLQDLLQATEGTGIYVYTHGEMLPAHAYPELKKYKHLYGNYGTAWQNQKQEFAQFPGPILMTTNCIQEPQESYKNSLYTTGPVGWPGVRHLVNGNFQELIKAAQAMPGFQHDKEMDHVLVGFGHETVLGVADKIIAAVKEGQLRHIFLVGGCDGAKNGRNYFSEFVEKSPADTAILTLGCGKYRFYDKKLGDIQGIPRLLDMGQCNDAYSAIQVAIALSQAFDCGVNELPLSLVLSWYEQKAVSILLTLLHLGIKDIRLGPSLPAFVSANVLDVLVKTFDIKPVSTVEQDLQAILG